MTSSEIPNHSHLESTRVFLDGRFFFSGSQRPGAARRGLPGRREKRQHGSPRFSTSLGFARVVGIPWYGGQVRVAVVRVILRFTVICCG